MNGAACARSQVDSAREKMLRLLNPEKLSIALQQALWLVGTTAGRITLWSRE